MADSHAPALDTSREARRLQVACWAEATPARKAEMVRALCRDVRTLARAGIRRRFPDSSAREEALRSST